MWDEHSLLTFSAGRLCPAIKNVLSEPPWSSENLSAVGFRYLLSSQCFQFVSYSAHVLQRSFVIDQLLLDWQSPQRGRKREKLQNMSTLLNHLDKRASADLKRRITSFLAQRGVNSVHRLNIEVNDGIVTLNGMVCSFYERQLCISCCQRTAGVVTFIDNLTVASPPSR